MRRVILTIAFTVLIVSGLTKAADKYFYSSGQILPGETWDSVFVYNDGTTIDMTGGLIDYRLELYDSSIFNANGGTMDIVFGGGSRITLFDESVINLRNLDGGETDGFPNTLIEAAGGSNPQINLYGYGFYFVGNYLHGYWSDGSSFLFSIRSNDETMNALVLHEIPEPATLLLLSVGTILIRRKR